MTWTTARNQAFSSKYNTPTLNRFRTRNSAERIGLGCSTMRTAVESAASAKRAKRMPSTVSNGASDSGIGGMEILTRQAVAPHQEQQAAESVANRDIFVKTD